MSSTNFRWLGGKIHTNYCICQTPRPWPGISALSAMRCLLCRLPIIDNPPEPALFCVDDDEQC